jgi:sterol desaturase/sphingolipid hydroxylase (fatty acid hydroxylase superfamily)
MIFDNEALIRLFSFALILAVMLALELALPRRTIVQPKSLRWTNNFAITMLNAVMLRLLFPAATVSVALYVEKSEFGLFAGLGIPYFLSIPLAIAALDLIIYAQHRLFHEVPLLWRIHRMHHSDIDIDVTTGLRFHPIEMLLSMLIKLLAIWLLGAPVIAVIFFEVILSAASMFNHANFHLPEKTDEMLRKAIVTPDMHRVHHSTRARETNSNFGFGLSCWDRLFDSYIAQPEDGHLEMDIGIAEFRETADIRLDKILMQPFAHSPKSAKDAD